MDNAIKYISLNELVPGEFHPHLEYTNDNIENLTNSIKNYGILEPLIVRPKDNKYEIILGNRRYKAAVNLGLDKVPVIILNLDDAKALELIISDNIQRKELSGKEEAYLYDKALSYPNTNTEKLSMNLGIPLDRITSKLNLLKKSKKEKPKELSTEQEIPNYNDNQNNSVNNDIINLSELNKKEEREDYIMNNNQFIGNENTPNTVNPQGQNPNTQEPAFGGRFFPSLEDEPTNMNLNENIGIVPTPQPQVDNNQPSPLIDLTDLSIGEQPVPTPQSDSNINIVPPLEPSSIGMPEQSNIGLDIPASQPTELNQQVNQPIDLTQNMNPIPSMDQPLDLSQFNQPQPTMMDNNIGVEQLMMPPQMESPIPMMNQQVPTMDQPVPMVDLTMNPAPMGMDNIPNLNTPSMDNQFAQPMDMSNPMAPTTQKDVLPVVNLIKNMAISLEAFGYKLNINESDLGQTYNITIEIEK